MRVIYAPKQRINEKRRRQLEIPGVQRVLVKVTILFLKHQQEVV